MEMQPFYRPTSSQQLCQGDIFDRLPLTVVKEAPRSLKKLTLRGNKEAYEVAEFPSVEQGSVSSGTVLIPTSCDHARAMLLTYDCEIDKPGNQLLTFAMIRRFAPNRTEDEKEQIRKGSKFAFFYLVNFPDGDPEGYVDFRRLSVIGVELVKTAKKVACLAETSRTAMLFQFFRFLTRIDLHQVNLPSPVDEAHE
jgi:hypothetical protein